MSVKGCKVAALMVKLALALKLWHISSRTSLQGLLHI